MRYHFDQVRLAVPNMDLPQSRQELVRRRLRHAAVAIAGWQVVRRRWQVIASVAGLVVAALGAPAIGMFVAAPAPALRSGLFAYGLAVVLLAALLLYERYQWSGWSIAVDLTPAVNDRWPAQRAVIMVVVLLAIRLAGWPKGFWLAVVVAVAAYTYFPWIQIVVRRFAVPVLPRLHTFRAPARWPVFPADLLLWRLFCLQLQAELLCGSNRHSVNTRQFVASWVKPVDFFMPTPLSPLGARRALARELERAARWCDVEWTAAGRHLVLDPGGLTELTGLGMRLASTLRSLRDTAVIGDAPAAGEVAAHLRELVLASATGRLDAVTQHVEPATTPQRARRLIARFMPPVLLAAAAVVLPVVLDLTDTQATPLRVALVLAAVLGLVRADRDTTDRILKQVPPAGRS